MTFQKRPKKSIDIKFNIGSESIEIVQEYTYLGTRLTPTGNFTLPGHMDKDNNNLSYFRVFKNQEVILT